MLLQVKAEYIADFYPSSFMSTGSLAHKYLLVPDIKAYDKTQQEKGALSDQDNLETSPAAGDISDSIHNVSEWMAVPKQKFDFTGSSCNKIGVYYPAFRNQGSRCHVPVGRSVNSD